MKKTNRLHNLAFLIISLSSLLFLGIGSNKFMVDQVSMYIPNNLSDKRYESLISDYNNYNLVPYYIAIKDKIFNSYN